MSGTRKTRQNMKRDYRSYHRHASIRKTPCGKGYVMFDMTCHDGCFASSSWMPPELQCNACYCNILQPLLLSQMSCH